MERSTVQSCLAAPVFLSRKPYKISINPRFRLTAGFSHFSYFGRNRPRKRVPTDTKLAQRFAFCPRIQTVQPVAISLRPTGAAADRAGAFQRPIRPRIACSNRTRPRGSLGARDSNLQDHRCAPPRSMTRALNRSRAMGPCRRRCIASATWRLNGRCAPTPDVPTTTRLTQAV
jgi:hypothetical protein